MSGYIRRYLSDPGIPELLAIEGVVIIDNPPATAIRGSGSGVVCLVGEFEKGPYTPIEITSGQDVINIFGGLGFSYGGQGGNNPCARSRKADGAAKPEYWNGNGFVALAGKRFSRLILQRVDTSVGSVSFTRLAFQEGNADFTWNLEPAQVLSVKKDGAAAASVTWDAAAAIYDPGAGTFPAVLTGGETITIEIDTGTAQPIGPVVVTVTAADTTQAALIARINAALGYAAAVSKTATATTLAGRIRGTSGKVKITQISTALATALNWAITTSSGTGDVANIDTVTFAEFKARVEADVSGTLVEKSANGNIRICSTTMSGTPSIEIVSATTTARVFGFVYDTAATPLSVGIDGKLPAGTMVSDSGDTVSWVTTEDVAVTALSAGPYTVKVRPTLDDGTAVAAVPGAVTRVVALPSDFGEWGVVNTFALSAALSESAIDAAYSTAIDATKNPNTVAKNAGFIVSARQSNACRIKLRSNALESSAKGLRGRIAIVRPPLGTTTRAIAKSATAQPGVGGYRNQRVVYAYPGVNINVPTIATLGVAGGAGFTADGNIDVGFDTWVAAICSQLPPEENPGQLTDFAVNVLGLEVGNPDVQSMEMDDYISFKAAGICAARMDDGVCIIQSGCTSVDPQANPGLVNIARRRMADFIQDSIAIGLKPFIKKLNNRTRRGLVISMIDGFLISLESPKNPDNQRIDSWLTDYKRGNTLESLAAGLFRPIIKVRTEAGMDVIVLDTEIGEGVLTVKEVA